MAIFGAIAQGLGGLGEAMGRAKTGAFDIRSKMLQDWLAMQYLKMQQLQQEYQQKVGSWQPYSVTTPDGKVEQGVYNILTGERKQIAAGVDPRSLEALLGQPPTREQREIFALGRPPHVPETEEQKMRDRMRIADEMGLKGKDREYFIAGGRSPGGFGMWKPPAPKKLSGEEYGFTASEMREFKIRTAGLQQRAQYIRSKVSTYGPSQVTPEEAQFIETLPAKLDAIAQEIKNRHKQPVPSHVPRKGNKVAVEGEDF